MSMIVRLELGTVELAFDDVPTSAQIDLVLESEIRRVQREAFAQALSEFESTLLEDRRCPACAGSLVVHDVDRRRVEMLAGSASVPLRRLRCQRCGHRSAPLARVLPSGKHTLPVSERALRLATEIGYAKSADLLHHLLGVRMSPEQIRRLAIAESERVDDSLERETEELFEHGVAPSGCAQREQDDTVVIAMDGGLVADRASGASFEARIGVVWCGTASVSKDRRALLDRRAHAGIEGTTEFAQHMSTLAIKGGALCAGRTVLIGDGAGWIRRTARDWFPGAVYVLDLYHLKDRIGELLCREGDEPVREAVVSACVRGRPDEAIGVLERFDPGADDRYRELHRRLMGYIRVNAEGIRNYVRTDLFGSGSVEKAVDVIVSRRFKCRGMSWLKPGAAGMLKLKLLRYNDDWETHWGSRFAEAA